MHRTLLLIFSIMVNHIFLGAIGYAADTGLHAAKKEAAVVVYTGSSAADAATPPPSRPNIPLSK